MTTLTLTRAFARCITGSDVTLAARFLKAIRDAVVLMFSLNSPVDPLKATMSSLRSAILTKGSAPSSLYRPSHRARRLFFFLLCRVNFCLSLLSVYVRIGRSTFLLMHLWFAYSTT